MLITASTETAISRLGLEKLGPRVVLQRRPVDCSSTLQRFLHHWRPSALLLIESELWPCLLMQSHTAGVPIALANGRLSDRSAARWGAAEPLRSSLGFLLSLCDVTLAQTPAMAARLRQLGAQRTEYVGDLKQLASTPPPSAAAIVELRAALGVSDESDSLASVRTAAASVAPVPASLASMLDPAAEATAEQAPGREMAMRVDATPAVVDAAVDATVVSTATAADAGNSPRRVWLAASTHAGEEAVVLEAHTMLRRTHPGLLLLLAPRHPERADAVAAAAAHTGCAVARRSRRERVGPSTAVYVCDTLGELPLLYAAAGLAFVGGSLVPLGGHNLLEAARVPGGCALLHGPHIEAVSASSARLVQTQPPAAQCVRTAAELAVAVGALLSCPATLLASRTAAAAVAETLELGVHEKLWSRLQVPLGLPPCAAAVAVRGTATRDVTASASTTSCPSHEKAPSRGTRCSHCFITFATPAELTHHSAHHCFPQSSGEVLRRFPVGAMAVDTVSQQRVVIVGAASNPNKAHSSVSARSAKGITSDTPISRLRLL